MILSTTRRLPNPNMDFEDRSGDFEHHGRIMKFVLRFQGRLGSYRVRTGTVRVLQESRGTGLRSTVLVLGFRTPRMRFRTSIEGFEGRLRVFERRLRDFGG